jgi:hypothetical protein
MARESKNTAIYTAYDESDASELPIPEKGLLRAVLLNAIADVNRNDEHSRKARDYFLSKEDDYIFSFQAICSYLHIEPRNILVLVGLEKPSHSKQQPQGQHDHSPDLVQSSLREAAERGDSSLS